MADPVAPGFSPGAVFPGCGCGARGGLRPVRHGRLPNTYLKGKSLAIACPKLDGNQEVYLEKVRGLFEESKINSLTVVIMQVPCCRGLLGLAVQALQQSSRKVPVKSVIVSLQGEVLQEEWATAYREAPAEPPQEGGRSEVKRSRAGLPHGEPRTEPHPPRRRPSTSFALLGYPHSRKNGGHSRRVSPVAGTDAFFP